ncbi:MAG: polysaccharide biosynthesis C-terminal domain-containing protein [Vicingaceae bacterium]
MSSLKNLVGQTAVYGLSSIIGRFLNYLLTPLYTYQFVSQEYGVVTEMYAYVAFLVVLLTYGMETAYFRFVSRHDDKNKVYSTALIPLIVSSAIFMSLAMVFSKPIASAISYPDYPEYVAWFAIIVGLDAITAIPLARLRQENKARRFALVNLSSIALNIGLNLFFIAYCKVLFDRGESNYLVDTFYNPAVGVGYIFIANLVSSIFKVTLLSPSFFKLKFQVDKALLKSMALYAAPLLVVGLAGIANENLDRLLLKFMLLKDHSLEETMSQVGIYGACYKVSILITLMVQAYRYAAEPFFFNQSESADSRKIYAKMLTYFVAACLVVFLALMVNIDLVMLFVGEEYRSGAVIVPILLMANIFLGIYYNLSVWYKLTDKTSYGAFISLVGAGITVTVNVVLIPRIGYIGSAWATLACYLSMTLLSYFLGRKFYKIDYPILRIGMYFATAIGFYFAYSALSSDLGQSKLVIGNTALLLVLLALAFLDRPKKIIT